MCAVIERIMNERLIDRTTVIKLALYCFDTYMRRGESMEMDLFDIVRDLEGAAPPEQSCFAHFSLSSRETKSSGIH